VSDLLPQINAMYQIQLQPSDIVDNAYTDLSQPVVVNSNPKALCFIGSLTLSVVGPKLLQLVPNGDLDGFNVYTPS
jgi:hypothetical protein